MTRCDYGLLAQDHLASVRPASGRILNHDLAALEQWDDDCRAVAEALARDSGRFDQTHFLSVCNR